MLVYDVSSICILILHGREHVPTNHGIDTTKHVGKILVLNRKARKNRRHDFVLWFKSNCCDSSHQLASGLTPPTTMGWLSTDP